MTSDINESQTQMTSELSPTVCLLCDHLAWTWQHNSHTFCWPQDETACKKSMVLLLTSCGPWDDMTCNKILLLLTACWSWDQMWLHYLTGDLLSVFYEIISQKMYFVTHLLWLMAMEMVSLQMCNRTHKLLLSWVSLRVCLLWHHSPTCTDIRLATHRKIITLSLTSTSLCSFLTCTPCSWLGLYPMMDKWPHSQSI